MDLLQEHDAILCPVAFTGHTLNLMRQDYAITETECLAIMFTLRKFNLYADSSKFTTCTDHGTFSWLQWLHDPLGHFGR